MQGIFRLLYTMKKIIFLLLALLPTLAAAQKSSDKYEVAAIGFYNLENLFDTIDSPTTNDIDFTPTGRLLWNTEKYISKQANMARVISELAADFTPDGIAVLGVAEVENRKVLDDLVQEPALKNRNYQVVHFDSPDERGIDCGFLYNPKYFRIRGAKPFPVALKQDSSTDYTRDIIYMAGELVGEPIHLLVGHWPSRRGGEAGSAWMRAAAADVCRHIADSIFAINPSAKIIIMGDLNDDPNSPSLTKNLDAKISTKNLKPGELYNTSHINFSSGNGTLAYRDSWNLFDQIVVSHGFVHKQTGGWQLKSSIVYRKPYLFQTDGAFAGYPFRTYVGEIFINGYSDHLPAYLHLIRKKSMP